MKKNKIIEKTFAKAKKKFAEHLVEKDEKFTVESTKDIVNKTFLKAKKTFADYMIEKNIDNVEIVEHMFDHSVKEVDFGPSSVTVTLMHNDTCKIFDAELTFSTLRRLPTLIGQHKEIIYDNYIKCRTEDKPKRTPIPFDDYGDDIRSILTGKFIVSENCEYICDENGAFLIYE
jgi:hypothetical protein